MDSSCYFDYVLQPITPYRELVFLEVIRGMKSGAIADIGCGPAPWYWALGYIHKAQSMTWIDINPSFIHASRQHLNVLSPHYLQEHCSDTLSYLKKEGIALGDAQQNARDFAEKCITVQVGDVHDQSRPSSALYDSIIAIESFEVVGSFDELIRAAHSIFSLLKPRGMFAGSVLRWDHKNQNVDELCAQKLEGILNPDAPMIVHALETAGFDSIHVTQHQTHEPNYSCAIFFHGAKLKEI